MVAQQVGTKSLLAFLVAQTMSSSLSSTLGWSGHAPTASEIQLVESQAKILGSAPLTPTAN